MTRARKQIQGWGIAAAALAGIWWAAPAGAAGAATLRLSPPRIVARRFGIAAAWPRWRIEAATARARPPAAGAIARTALAARPSLAEAKLERPALAGPRAAPIPAAPPPPSPSPVAAAQPGTGVPAASLLLKDPQPALQTAVVERELTRRAIQRAAADDFLNIGPDRRELALRALMAWQLPDSAPPTPAADALRQIGLERWRIGQALAPGTGVPGLEMESVGSRGGGIQRRQLQLGGGNGSTFHLSMVNVARGFKRFQDLTAEERSWAGAISGMRRLEFGGDKIALAGGQSQLGLLELTDGKAKARRMSLGFTGKQWSVAALSQRIDDGFKRLGDLTDADKKTFGAERGIARDSLELGYALGKSRKLAASSLNLRAASGAAELHQFGYSDGPRLQLQYNFGRVDPKFDRVADLMQPDRNALAPQQGMRWSDLTANVSPARWLTTTNHWYDGASLTTGQRSARLENTWTLQFAPRSKLVLMRNLLTAPSGKAGRSRALTQSVRLEQWLSRSLFFTGMRETVQNALTGSPERMTRQTVLHLNTAPKMALQASADYTTAVGTGGKRDRLLQWSLGLPLRRGLALQAKGDQHDMPGKPAAGGLSLGVNGPVARGWDLALSLNRANPSQGPSTQELGARLTFAGLKDTRLFRETHLVFAVGDTLGLPSAVPVIPPAAKAPAAAKSAPRTPSPPPVPIRRLQSITLETKHRGQPLSLGIAAAAGTVGGFTYHWSTDPKRRLQLEALREVRDLGHTSLVARQRYALRETLGRKSQLYCSYEIQPETSPGKLLLGHTQTRAAMQTQLGGLAVSANLSLERDEARNVTTTLAGLSLAGDLDTRSNLNVSYAGSTHGTDPAIPIHDVRLAFERKPDEALRAALGAEWRAWRGKRADELAWQVDLTAVF